MKIDLQTATIAATALAAVLIGAVCAYNMGSAASASCPVASESSSERAEDTIALRKVSRSVVPPVYKADSEGMRRLTAQAQKFVPNKTMPVDQRHPKAFLSVDRKLTKGSWGHINDPRGPVPEPSNRVMGGGNSMCGAFNLPSQTTKLH